MAKHGLDECFVCGTGAEVTQVSEIGAYNFRPAVLSRTLISDYSAEIQPLTLWINQSLTQLKQTYLLPLFE